MNRVTRLMGLAGALAGTLTLATPRTAVACGCFTPPNPAVPIVQAGERIVFATDNGQITAHIQIQYAGDAQDFGWLLPLPSIPVLELGADELFTQLTTQTQPKYELKVLNTCGSSNFAVPGAAADDTNGATATVNGGGQSSPLVIQDSIGPYDYAVLKADDQSAMLAWLATNHYFVPAGTDAAVVPYIHPGAFFLALKLKSGKSAGDLQPVVVHYASDLPMIPIVLTSTAAQPDMGIQVWMLGTSRAIPRNYYHTVIDDALLDWVNAASNYNDVIIKATKEAAGRHTFVTEYAGSSSIMKGILDPPGRFGTQAQLAAQTDAASFVVYLRNNGFGITSSSGFAGSAGGASFGFGVPAFSGALLAILEAAIPYPAGLAAQGVTAAAYYAQLDYYLGDYRTQNPALFAGLDFTIDSVTMASDVWTRVVTPTLTAAALFDASPYLTRLYTTLSPEQMNSDPVFSYNPDLPDVSNVHQATETLQCSLGGGVSGATITTEQGWKLTASGTSAVQPATDVPGSLRIEILRESGAPEDVTDNSNSIRKLLGEDGCSVVPGAASRGHVASLLLMLGALGMLLRRRRAA